MVVTIAGIKRSGSTAMYNIVRLVLLEAGYDINICGHSWDARRKKMLGKKEADIIKRHPYSEQIANLSDHIFLTDRDDEGILQSLDRMWGSGNPERLEDMRKHLDKWKQHTDQDHIYQYEDFINASDYMISKIICVLGLPFLDVDTIVSKFESIEPPEKKQDPVTLLFPNHISE